MVSYTRRLLKSKAVTYLFYFLELKTMHLNLRFGTYLQKLGLGYAFLVLVHIFTHSDQNLLQFKFIKIKINSCILF